MKKRSDIFLNSWSVTAFILPVICILLTLRFAPGNLFSSVSRQYSDIGILRSAFSGGRLFYPDAVCDILTRRFYPSFIICLLIGGTFGRFLLRIFFFLRFGLLSLGMFLLCERTFKIQRLWALIFGLIYSVSSVSIAATVNPQVFNVMIVMPFAAFFIGRCMEDGSLLLILKTALVLSFFGSGGIYGLLSGIIFTLSCIWLFKSMYGFFKVGGCLISLLFAVFLELPVIIPLLSAEMDLIDLKDGLENSRVTFALFDLICTMLDGNGIELPSSGMFPVMGISIFVLTLVLLFFLNREIPFRAKLTGLILILLISVSCSWSLPNSVLSVFGNAGTTAFSRFTVLAMLLFIMAGASFSGIKKTGRREIYIAVFSVLALIVVSNSSSSSEVSGSFFHLWFSAAAAIICGMIFMMLSGEGAGSRGTFILAGVIAAGVLINTGYCLSISALSGSITSIAPYSASSSSDPVRFYDCDDIPLLGGMPEYVIVPCDMRAFSGAEDVPEIINHISEVLTGQILFEKEESFPVFTEGITGLGDGLYSVVNPGAPTELLVRCEGVDSSEDYYLFSSADGEMTVVETYAAGDITGNLRGPFLKRLSVPGGSNGVTVRQTGPVMSDKMIFGIWKENSSVSRELLSVTHIMSDYKGEITTEDNDLSGGMLSIITSVPYREDYQFRVAGNSGTIPGEVYSLGGKVAATFEYSRGDLISFRIDAGNRVPVVSLAIFIISYAGIILVILQVSRKGKRAAAAEGSI